MSPSCCGGPFRDLTVAEDILFEEMHTLVPHYIVMYVASCGTRTHHPMFKFDAQYHLRSQARPVQTSGR